jgi:hypothetical protein
MWLIVLFILIIAYFILNYSNTVEHFFPFLDSLGTTRNMSYDIRGDPYIPYTPVSPWNQPSVFPIRNREMILY